MIQRVYWDDFTDAFMSLRPDNFTYEGIRFLWDYFESDDDHLGELVEPVELDVIAFCCEYSEDSEESIRAEQGLSDHENISEWLHNHTEVIAEWRGGEGKRFLYRQF